jgi:hypothetical protein
VQVDEKEIIREGGAKHGWGCIWKMIRKSWAMWVQRDKKSWEFWLQLINAELIASEQGRVEENECRIRRSWGSRVQVDKENMRT